MMNGGPYAPTAADYANSAAADAKTSAELLGKVLGLIIGDLEHQHLLDPSTLDQIKSLLLKARRGY